MAASSASSHYIWPLDDPSFATSDRITYRFLFLPTFRRPVVSPAETGQIAGVVMTIKIPDSLSETLARLHRAAQILKKQRRHNSCTYNDISNAQSALCSAPALIRHNAEACRKALKQFGQYETDLLMSSDEPNWLTGRELWSGVEEGVLQQQAESIALAEAAFWLHVWTVWQILEGDLSEELIRNAPSPLAELTSFASAAFDLLTGRKR